MIEFLKVDVSELRESTKKVIEESLGRKVSLADPLYLFMNSLLSVIVQQQVYINDIANQNLLAYARGGNLEAIGELVGVTRRKATAAFTTAEVTLSTARAKETIIKQHTRFHAGDNVYFELYEDVIFLAGETVKQVRAECLRLGEIGNGYGVGELNKVVDPQPFLKSITNLTYSEGGSEIENDDELRERIRIKPESFSVAGPAGAYNAFCKEVSTDIIDSYTTSPEPGYVDVYFLLKEGIPGVEMLQAVEEHLSAEEVRPLTDYVRVKAAESVGYHIKIAYWISRSEATRATTIIGAVEAAVEEYAKWQRSKLGRDISPNELLYRVRAAGADRIVIESPEFREVLPQAVAIAESITIDYRGLKDQ